MELWVTKDTTRFPAQKSQPVQQRRASQGSSPEGARPSAVGAGGNPPVDSTAPDQVLNPKTELGSGNQQFFLSLDKFMKDFNEADEDQFLKNLADLRSKCFNEDSI